MSTRTSKSLEETAAIAREWLDAAAAGRSDPGSATVAALSGHLGAGKTAFVKEAAKAMGVEEEVTSPSFVIMKAYPTKHPAWGRLVHVDAYRLEKRSELEAIRWEDLVSDDNNLIMIEWPENVGLSAADTDAWLRFSIEGGDHTISIG